jgi:hypothetical protein
MFRDRRLEGPAPYAQSQTLSLEICVACKGCGSANLQRLKGELSASFPDLRRANLPPIYICQEVTVCLDCGHAELVIPAPELERLKQGSAAAAS